MDLFTFIIFFLADEIGPTHLQSDQLVKSLLVLQAENIRLLCRGFFYFMILEQLLGSLLLFVIGEPRLLTQVRRTHLFHLFFNQYTGDARLSTLWVIIVHLYPKVWFINTTVPLPILLLLFFHLLLFLVILLHRQIVRGRLGSALLTQLLIQLGQILAGLARLIGVYTRRRCFIILQVNRCFNFWFLTVLGRDGKGWLWGARLASQHGCYHQLAFAINSRLLSTPSGVRRANKITISSTAEEPL